MKKRRSPHSQAATPCSLPELGLGESSAATSETSWALPKEQRGNAAAVRVTGLDVLRARKRSAHALIAATGLSTGRLNRDQSAFLMSRTDVWGINQVFLHHYLVPAFYNLEMRTLPDVMKSKKRDAGQMVSNTVMWNLFEGAKRNAYNDTVFLTREEHATDVRKLLRRASPCLVRTACIRRVSRAYTCLGDLVRVTVLYGPRPTEDSRLVSWTVK